MPARITTPRPFIPPATTPRQYSPPDRDLPENADANRRGTHWDQRADFVAGHANRKQAYQV
ncbi:MAG: hypothetical protein KC418_07320 [Anaerolineales bacterium]|nr:hypothetical protein [Anaerolineales bacterium]MCB8950579.1 hypothetical protein [Ardenticatenales bacterium]